MRTNYVLIDFESVQPKSLASLPQDHFRILIFLGASQAKVPVETVEAVQRMGQKAEYVRVSRNGPNALDFHIAFYIGQLAAQDSTAYFHIISKDKGFDPLIDHLHRKKIFSARSPSIEDIPMLKVGKMSTEERAQLLIEKLKQPKVTKPRTQQRLSCAIAAFFRKQLTDQDVTAIIETMQRVGFVSLVNGKVTYG